MKVKDLPLGVELKRHYSGEYRIRRTKEGTTTIFHRRTFREAIDVCRMYANADKDAKREP